MSRVGLDYEYPQPEPPREPVVKGVGADAPTRVNQFGGKQSASPYRSDLFPPFAFLKVAEILKHGADKYGENNWHLIPVRENIDHALTHLMSYLAGDTSDDHLPRAACRIMFALDQREAGRPAAAEAAPEAPAPVDAEPSVEEAGDECNEGHVGNPFQMIHPHHFPSQEAMMDYILTDPAPAMMQAARRAGERAAEAMNKAVMDAITLAPGSCFVAPEGSTTVICDGQLVNKPAPVERLAEAKTPFGGRGCEPVKPAAKPAERLKVYIAGPISQGDLTDNVNAATEAFKQLVEAGFAPWCPQWSVFSGGCGKLAHGAYYHRPGDPRADSDGDLRILSGTPIAVASVLGSGFDHVTWLTVDLPWVRAADAILRLPGASHGADAEEAAAKEDGIPVFYSIPELLAWKADLEDGGEDEVFDDEIDSDFSDWDSDTDDSDWDSDVDGTPF